MNPTALLAILGLVAYEAVIIMVTLLMWTNHQLSTEFTVTVITAAQSPALAGIGFYFGSKRNGNGPKV